MAEYKLKSIYDQFVQCIEEIFIQFKQGIVKKF